MNVQQFLTADERWDAVCARDNAADGAFLFAVRTTGVYCRPHCAARRPLRSNVEFFERPSDAEAAGYRACKRCVPSGVPEAAQIALVDAACRAIENAEQLPTLGELAVRAGRSPAYFQRLFKRIVGVSPREYGVAKRAERLRAGLVTQRSVTTAIHDAGFGSASRAYDTAAQTLGMSPGAYRDRGRGMRVMYTIVQSTLGWIGLAATERGVAAIELADDAEIVRTYFLDRFANASLVENDPALRANVEAVLAYLKRPARAYRYRTGAACNLRRCRACDRRAESRARRRDGVRCESGCARDPVPPRHPNRRHVRRLSLR